MNMNEIKGQADQLKGKAEELMGKAQDYIQSGDMKDDMQEKINQAKDWLQSGEGKEYLEKGKQMLSDAKDKAEDFVADKTGGKGVFGFGKTDAPTAAPAAH